MNVSLSNHEHLFWVDLGDIRLEDIFSTYTRQSRKYYLSFFYTSDV